MQLLVVALHKLPQGMGFVVLSRKDHRRILLGSLTTSTQNAGRPVIVAAACVETVTSRLKLLFNLGSEFRRRWIPS